MVKNLASFLSRLEFHRDPFLDLLLFLIHINDLPDGLHSIAKSFADDTSLFLFSRILMNQLSI